MFRSNINFIQELNYNTSLGFIFLYPNNLYASFYSMIGINYKPIPMGMVTA